MVVAGMVVAGMVVAGMVVAGTVVVVFTGVVTGAVVVVFVVHPGNIWSINTKTIKQTANDNLNLVIYPPS